MFRLGPWEIAVIVGIVVMIFGPKRLPELGKGIGDFVKNLSSSLKGEKDEKKPPSNETKNP